MLSAFIGFRDELHGACTQEWDYSHKQQPWDGIADLDIQQMGEFNLTISQVYCEQEKKPTFQPNFNFQSVHKMNLSSQIKCKWLVGWKVTCPTPHSSRPTTHSPSSTRQRSSERPVSNTAHFIWPALFLEISNQNRAFQRKFAVTRVA